MADPGVKSRRRIQLGLEGTPGTAVPATTIWRGPAVLMKDTSIKKRPPENVGYRVNGTRIYTAKNEASLQIPETELTFEQGPYAFSAGVTNVVSGAANGGTSNAYKYPYVLPVASDPSYKTYTIETGDNQAAEEMEGAFCEEINLKGTPNDAVMIASKWVGRQRLTSAFTAGLTPVTVEEVLFNKGKLYIDASTIGNTQATNTWLGFEMTIKPGLQAVYTGDGNLYYSFVKGVEPVITGKVTFEHDATGVAQKALYAAGNTRKFRMQFDGSAIGFTGSGGTFAARMFRMDFAANIESYDDGEQNGDDIVTINFTQVYDGTLGFEATFCNILAALL